MRNIYVIGPSGVGKSTIGELLAERGLVIHRDLDHILEHANPGRARIDVAQDPHLVMPMLESLDEHEAPVPIMINIGSGTQDMDRHLVRALGLERRLEPWLRERADRTVLVEGDPDALFARWRRGQAPPNRDVFDELEYGPDRRRIYRLASHVISAADTTPEDSAQQLVNLLGLQPVPQHPSRQ